MEPCGHLALTVEQPSPEPCALKKKATLISFVILQVSTLGSIWQAHSRVRGQVPGWLEADWPTVASIVVVGWLCVGSRGCLGSVPPIQQQAGGAVTWP